MYRSVHLNTTNALTRRGCCLLLAGALTLAAACEATETASSSTTAFSTSESLTLAPGIVLEPTRGNVYLMAPDGGIDKLNIDDGRLLWTSTLADQPLFVAGERLLATIESSAAGLTIAFLDPASGRPAANADEPLVLPLPGGVTAGIDHTLEREFRHSVRKSGDETYLSWEFLQRNVTGVAPPDGRSSVRREQGSFRFSGLTFDAEAPDSIIVDPKNWPSEIDQLIESNQIRRPPSDTGKVFAITEQRYDPERLVLRRWRVRDGSPMEDKLLYDGRSLAVLVSCDERHIVVAIANVPAASVQPYVLRYYDLDSGALLAELPSSRSSGPFCLSGSRLLQLSQPEWRRVQGAIVARPLELVALDVASGTEVWRRAVRDTAFRGLAPPAN